MAETRLLSKKAEMVPTTIKSRGLSMASAWYTGSASSNHSRLTSFSPATPERRWAERPCRLDGALAQLKHGQGEENASQASLGHAPTLVPGCGVPVLGWASQANQRGWSPLRGTQLWFSQKSGMVFGWIHSIDVHHIHMWCDSVWWAEDTEGDT